MVGHGLHQRRKDQGHQKTEAADRGGASDAGPPDGLRGEDDKQLDDLSDRGGQKEQEEVAREQTHSALEHIANAECGGGKRDTGRRR